MSLVKFNLRHCNRFIWRHNTPLNFLLCKQLLKKNILCLFLFVIWWNYLMILVNNQKWQTLSDQSVSSGDENEFLWLQLRWKYFSRQEYPDRNAPVNVNTLNHSDWRYWREKVENLVLLATVVYCPSILIFSSRPDLFYWIVL